MSVIESHGSQEYAPSREALRRRAIAGMVAAAPAVYFIAANVLKFELGVDGAFYEPIATLTATPGRARLFNAVTPFVFIGGLLAGVALNLFPLVRWRARLAGRSVVGRLRMLVSPLNILVAMGSGGALGALTLYLVMENIHHITR